MKAIKNIKKKRVLVCSCAVFLAFTLTFSVTASAATSDTSSGKEEVVYAMLNNDGSTNGMYVVNIFNKDGRIVDYGDYSAVRNLTTNDKISQNGNKITVSNTGSQLYYEGTLKKMALPWNISIRYYLDGKEYSTSEIAGKTGALTIKMEITKNPYISETFYKNYALQAAFTLDSNKCKNIVADGATIANVGGNKQLNYTILPNKGVDVTITADVTNFTMDAVTINGVRLNLNVKVDNTDLMKKVDELKTAVNTLDNGAGAVKNGASAVKGGTDKLASGADALKTGSANLDSGVTSLKSGIEQVQSGLDALNSKSSSLTSGSAQMKSALLKIQSSLSGVSATSANIDALDNASSQIKTGINGICSGLNLLKTNVGYTQYKAAMSAGGLNIDTLKAGNSGTINALKTQIASLTVSYNAIKGSTDPSVQSQAAQLKSQIDQITDIVTLLSGNNAAIGGTEAYLNSVSSSISQLYTGASTLNTQYAVFDSKIAELGQALNEMAVNMSTLSNAINTLVSNYTMLDSGINEYTGGVAKIIAGYSGIANGVDSLATGSKSLADGNSTLYSGITDLMSGVSKLYSGTGELKSGTGEFKDKTANLDTQVNQQIDNLLAELKGDSGKQISYVSSENTNVKSVQFVIKTASIDVKKAPITTEAKPKEMTVWQKFLNLFGLYKK